MFQSILLLINFCLVGIVPGFLLYKIIFKGRGSRFYEYLPVSFALSLAVLVVPTFLAFYFALSLNFIIYFFFSALFLIFIIFLFRYRKEIITRKSDNSAKPKLNTYLKILILVCLIVFIRAAFTPGLEQGDSWRHVSDIRKIIELPKIVSGSSFIEEFKGIGNYGYNVWHVALAIITKLSRVDIVDTWRFSPTFIAVFLILGYFFLAKELFKSEKIALFATTVFFIWEGVLGYDTVMPKIDDFWLWSQSAIPSFIARDIMLTVVLAFCFKYIRDGKRKYLYLISVLTLALSFAHIYYFMILILLLALVLFFGLIFRHKDKILLKRVLTIIPFVLIPSIFYVYYISVGLTPIKNPVFFSPTISGNQPVRVFHGFPIMDPFKITYFGFVHWFSFLLMPLLIFLISKKRYALYLFAFFLGPVLIIFNPILVKILQKFNPTLELVWRLNEIIPFTQTFGLFLFLGWEKFGQSIKEFIKKQTKWKVALFSLMMVVILITLVGKSIIILYLGGLDKPTQVSAVTYLWENKDFRKTVRENIPIGDTVLMDGFSSIYWTYYYPHYLVGVNWGFNDLIPPTWDQTQRYNDLDKYMQQEKLNQWSFDFLNKYNVDYILVNKHVKNNDYEISPQLPDPFGNTFPQKTYYSEKDFFKYSGKFKLVYDSTNLSLYKYNK